jgi:hypothetical protein
MTKWPPFSVFNNITILKIFLLKTFDKNWRLHTPIKAEKMITKCVFFIKRHFFAEKGDFR